MGLRETAAADLKSIHENTDDFAWEITVTDPDGNTHVDPLYGLSNDISQAIDPETGMLVSGRSASVSIPIKSLLDAGFTSLPINIPDKTSRPWVIMFDDILGTSWTFKVSQSNPDRSIGSIVCLLETYDDS